MKVRFKDVQPQGWGFGTVKYRGQQVNCSWWIKTKEEIEADPWDGLEYIHMWLHRDLQKERDETICCAVFKVTQRTVKCRAYIGGDEQIVNFVRSDFE